MDAKTVYLCIDLKSFYASVECVERGLDPLTTNLVVADRERTEKTICLAVSPSLKALGVANRCRLFQIPPHIPYIAAKPRMQLYLDYSANIYAIYLKYLSKDDIHVYSIDEAFLDVTHYLPLYRTTPRALAQRIMQDILDTTGITATCGIGTNLYLTKIALDITAKHVTPSPGGARIGVLDEARYRKTLWDHQPITDFWRIGRGTANRLARYGIHTMRQITQTQEELLYRTFGVDAELLIDHAWGREPVTIADIKAFRPQSSSLSSGQVLPRGYTPPQARIIVREMADALTLELVEQKLVSGGICLYLGYDRGDDDAQSHGSCPTGTPTNSSKLIGDCACALFDRIVNRRSLVHRVTLSFQQVEPEGDLQYDLFSPVGRQEQERSMQQALLRIQKKYGKNAIFKGMDLQEGATALARNEQIGGHRA